MAKRSKRKSDDNYPTPAALARVGWTIAQRYVSSHTRLRVCEPGCGDAQPFLRAAAADPRVEFLCGVDIRGVDHASWQVEREGVARTLYARTDWEVDRQGGDGPWDVIISNPPFKRAEEFARVALARLAPGGVVVFLTRQSFLGSDRRRAFWQECPPSEVVVIRPRPSFTVDGGTDGAEYNYVVWCPSAGQAPRLTWVDWPKPPAARRQRAEARAVRDAAADWME